MSFLVELGMTFFILFSNFLWKKHIQSFQQRKGIKRSMAGFNPIISFLLQSIMIKVMSHFEIWEFLMMTILNEILVLLFIHMRIWKFLLSYLIEVLLIQILFEIKKKHAFERCKQWVLELVFFMLKWMKNYLHFISTNSGFSPSKKV